MFDRLVEDFCQFDDFCQAFGPHWQARLLSEQTQPAKKRGPQPGLVDSEIMTILVLYHSSNFCNFKAFYEGVVLTLLRSAFPKPAYQPITPLTPSAKSMQNRLQQAGNRIDASDHAGVDGRRVRAAVRHGRAVSGGVGEGPPGRGHAMPALRKPQKLRL